MSGASRQPDGNAQPRTIVVERRRVERHTRQGPRDGLPSRFESAGTGPSQEPKARVHAVRRGAHRSNVSVPTQCSLEDLQRVWVPTTQTRFDRNRRQPTRLLLVQARQERRA